MKENKFRKGQIKMIKDYIHQVKAILYTGVNRGEIKEFLGEWEHYYEGENLIIPFEGGGEVEVNPADYVIKEPSGHVYALDAVKFEEDYRENQKVEPANDDWKRNRDYADCLKAVVNNPTGIGFRLPQWSPDVVIKLQLPDENSKMTAPYLYVESRYGRVPWIETNIEKFSQKWELVTFEMSYEEVTQKQAIGYINDEWKRNRNFSTALDWLKSGHKVARSGWNGKGMYIWLVPEATVPKGWVKDKGLLEAIGENDSMECLGFIRMKTADGRILSGWLASQTDMLAEDWEIIE